jgi:HlyD family secretion protein
MDVKSNSMTTIHKIIVALFFFPLIGCQQQESRSDAYGNFEATETTISAEASGKLLAFKVEEGASLKEGDIVGLIDTTQLHLQRLQLQATFGAIDAKTQDPSAEIAVLEAKKEHLFHEKERVSSLLAEKAATDKQLDDLVNQIKVVEKQIAAAKSKAGQMNEGVLSEKAPLRAQIAVLNEQIRRCYIVNPKGGTVLTQLVEPAEVVRTGSPLYRIADLSTLSLRAYISGAQLPNIRIGQTVEVIVDSGSDVQRSMDGTISWISDQAEFTPKTIQTREERTSLVYAIKVDVPNDGSLKIGMPGEILFDPNAEVSAVEK